MHSKMYFFLAKQREHVPRYRAPPHTAALLDSRIFLPSVTMHFCRKASASPSASFSASHSLMTHRQLHSHHNITQTFLNCWCILSPLYRPASQNTLLEQVNIILSSPSSRLLLLCFQYNSRGKEWGREEKQPCVWLFWAHCKWMAKQANTIKINTFRQFALSYHKEDLFCFF